MRLEKILESLSNANGVSGSEMRIGNEISFYFKQYCDQVKSDKLGNIVAFKPGNSQKRKNTKIMLAAHMDEIGLMVKKIDNNGFILFTNVGGIDERTLLSQEVIVHGNKEIYGIIGAKPPHLLKEQEKNSSIKIEELYIDVGMSEKEAKKVISIGDFITIKREFKILGRDFVAGKALDNRAGIAVILECMKELQNMSHSIDIYFVATVQEEVGLRGAITSTYHIMPDLGIAIDVGHGRTPELPKEETIELGKGPGITLGPNIHPSIHKRFVDISREYNIPYQIEVCPEATGTDAWAIQVTQSGVPTGLLSIPLRYMHTSVELLNMRDIVHSGRLLAFFIASLNEVDMEEWLCY